MTADRFVHGGGRRAHAEGVEHLALEAGADQHGRGVGFGGRGGVRVGAGRGRLDLVDRRGVLDAVVVPAGEEDDAEQHGDGADDAEGDEGDAVGAA
jgi:hypothetical protein